MQDLSTKSAGQKTSAVDLARPSNTTDPTDPKNASAAVGGGGAGGAGGGVPDVGMLPNGWEAKIDKTSNRVFYVDHNNKTTSWEHPHLLQKPQPAPAATSPPPSASVGTLSSLNASPLTAGKHLLGLEPLVSHSHSDGDMQRLPGAHKGELEQWEPLTPWWVGRGGQGWEGGGWRRGGVGAHEGKLGQWELLTPLCVCVCVCLCVTV